MTKEINIIEIVKSHRMIERALKLLLSKEMHRKLLKSSEYRLISSEVLEDSELDRPKEPTKRAMIDEDVPDVIEQGFDDLPSAEMNNDQQRTMMQENRV